MRRRYEPNILFQEFISQYDLPAEKITRICKLKKFQLYAISKGYQKEPEGIREQIKKGIAEYGTSLIKKNKKIVRKKA